jgi:hypothetical protein
VSAVNGHERRRSIRSARWAEDFKGETALAALGIPLPAARCLYAAGYRTRQDIEDSPDRELLLAPGIGPARLASIRAAVPYDPQWEAGEGEAS